MSEETRYTLTVFGPELVVYEERGNSIVVGPPHLKDYWLSLTDEEQADELAFKDALKKFLDEALARRIAKPLAGTVFETPESSSQTPASPSQP